MTKKSVRGRRRGREKARNGSIRGGKGLDDLEKRGKELWRLKAHDFDQQIYLYLVVAKQINSTLRAL